MSLDEPDSTDRNNPLGQQAWNTDPDLTTTDLSFDNAGVDNADVDNADADNADVDNSGVVDANDDGDDLLETVHAISASVTSFASVIDSADAAVVGNAVYCAVSVADVLHVVSVEPKVVHAAGSEDICHSIADSLLLLRKGKLEGAAISICRQCRGKGGSRYRRRKRGMLVRVFVLAAYRTIALKGGNIV